MEQKRDRSIIFKKVFYAMLIFSIIGFFFGAIFNYFPVGAMGLNRYLFIYFIPPIFIIFKKRRRYFSIILGLSLGLFFSDFQDFAWSFIHFDWKEWSGFFMMFYFYIGCIYFINKYKK